MKRWQGLLGALAIAGVAAGQQPDPDTDGDGLCDFQETHKYLSDPRSSDSDRDGLPDGDWSERREWAYTVRSVVQVLRPVTADVLCDDYQDARILDETEEYVELEVVHYPLNTVAAALAGDPDWRTKLAGLERWLAPGPTSNWDEPMRADLFGALARDGIDAQALDDRTLVERASKWLLDRARSLDGFTTFLSRFVDGRVELYPGLEETARRELAKTGLTLEEQWQRELFARGMYEHRTRGTCTSTAIYLDGCLRALGVPTRIVLAIPVVDASDEREVALVERLRHHRVRYTIQQGIAALGNSWASHTFDEVWVGGRWRRLNYERLGQNTLDARCLGLLTHVATFSDWAEGDMAATWGTRQARSEHDDAFGGSNPYSTIALSERFGVHAQIENDPVAEDFTRLTIERAYWYDSEERPSGVELRLDDPENAGHVLVHVREHRAGEGKGQYKRFWDRVGKRFVLRASGQADVPLQAERGYWVFPERDLREFYLRIEPGVLGDMAFDVPYSLVPLDDVGGFRWEVAPDVRLVRRQEPATTVRAPPAAPPELVIDAVCWSDGPDSPTGPLQGMGPVLLLHVGRAQEFDSHKRFTQLADRLFYLQAPGRVALEAETGIGGVTTREESYVVLDPGPLEPGLAYELLPRNGVSGHGWKLARPFRIVRE